MKTKDKIGKLHLIWVLVLISTLDLFFFVLPEVRQTNFRDLELLPLAVWPNPNLQISLDSALRTSYSRVQDRIFLNGQNEICPEQKLTGNHTPSSKCIAFFVWRTPWSHELELTLNGLVQQNPADVESALYLAELYHRRGEYDRAMLQYKQILKIRPDYDRVYLALGVLIEEQINGTVDREEDLWEAVHWYEKYRESAPNDLFALSRLNKICKQVSCQETARLQADWDKRTEKDEVAAQLLKVNLKNINVGENLLKYTPILSDVTNSSTWKFSLRHQGIVIPVAGGSGNVVGGVDPLMVMGNGSALRIDGLSKENTVGYVGEFYDIWPELQPNEPYLITFFYKSSRCRDLQPSFWTQLREEGTISPPETGEEWWQAAFLVWPQRAQETLAALQNSGPCQVWYDEISVQKLDIRSESDSLQVGSGGVRLGKRVIGGVSALGWDTIWWQ